MPRVRFTLPEVKRKPDERPSTCPRCGGVIFHKRGQMDKAIKDLYISRATAVRYRCVDCGGTFRRYLEGVDRHTQSKRLRALSALSWALGGKVNARVEVVGADETVLKLKGEKAVVGFVTDAERGRLWG